MEWSPRVSHAQRSNSSQVYFLANETNTKRLFRKVSNSATVVYHLYSASARSRLSFYLQPLEFISCPRNVSVPAWPQIWATSGVVPNDLCFLGSNSNWWQWVMNTHICIKTLLHLKFWVMSCSKTCIGLFRNKCKLKKLLKSVTSLKRIFQISDCETLINRMVLRYIRKEIRKLCFEEFSILSK